jgi:translation initiation factor 1
MAKQKFSSGLVYSTNKLLMQPEEEIALTELKPDEQYLKIRLDTKQRAGKIVTIISGFEGAGIEQLTKSLKNHCGTGGSAKEGEILIQGDNREKVLQWLLKNGYKQTKKQ